jgi:hypothetical protein
MNVRNKREYYGTSTMTVCHLVNSRYLKIGAIFVGSCVNLFPSAAFALPRVPTDAAEVLERLPMRPGDTTARELASLRAAVIRAAKEAPADPLPATQLAERYFDLAAARGDPRYVGYADAVMLPFAASQSPAALSMRGQLKQYRHDFDGALSVARRDLFGAGELQRCKSGMRCVASIETSNALWCLHWSHACLQRSDGSRVWCIAACAR